MQKFKIFPVTIGVALVCIPLIIFFAQNVFTKLQTDSILPTALPTITNQKSIVLPTPISKPLSQTKTFPHELLPGFNITIPSSWVITGVKQFGEKDAIGFASNYFPSLPVENAMAFRIFKNGTFFNLIFDLIYDGSNSCSDNLSYLDIGNGWYQIKNANSYYYSKDVIFNGMKAGGEDPHRYKLCTLSGVIISDKPSKLISPYGDGAIMLENIRVYGNPNQEVLDEINQIVRSIVY